MLSDEIVGAWGHVGAGLQAIVQESMERLDRRERPESPHGDRYPRIEQRSAVHICDARSWGGGGGGKFVASHG